MHSLAFINSSVAWGGLEMNMVKLARWFIERGTSVCIYCVADSRISLEATRHDIPWVPIEKPWKYGDVACAWKISRLLKSPSLTALLFFQNHDLSLAAWLRKFCAARLSFHFVQQMGIGVDKRDILHTRRYAALDSWIAPLESLAAEVRQRTNYDAGRIHVVPLGVDTRAFPLHMDRQQARELLGLDPKTFVLGIVGRFDEAKGQRFVIESLERFNGQENAPHVVLIGEATRGMSHDYEVLLQERVRDLGMSDRVHFRPFMDDPAVCYHAIDALVMATRSETYGMVTLEALMSACPVLATRSGGSVELLAEGQRGLLFKPMDTEDFLRALNYLRSHYAECKARALVQQQGIREQYSYEQQCRGIEAVIQSCSQTPQTTDRRSIQSTGCTVL